MNRRQMLLVSGGSLVFGVSGCMGDSSDTISNNGNGQSIEQSAEYELTVDDADASGAVQLDAIVEQHVTDEHPGTLSMELTNGGDEQRTFWYIGGTMAPFNQEWLSHEKEDASVLILARGLVDNERHGGCWMGNGDDDVRRHATLNPGDSRSHDVAVVSGWVPRGREDPPATCFKAGDYIGEQSLDLYESVEGVEQYREPQGEKVGETTFTLTISLSN